MASSTTIDSLPPELLSHILSFVGGPAPSDVRLRDQPSRTMLASTSTPLKFASLVCKRWRACALPILFRHVLWAFDRWDIVFSESGTFDAANPTSLPLISFIRDNNLGAYVESLTLIVSDRMYRPPQYQAGNYQPGREYFDIGGLAGGSARDSDADPQDTGFQVPFDPRAQADWVARWRQHSALSEDSNWLWKLLFDAMDPKRFTIIALPRMLASLLSRMLFLGDAWSFRDQRHILSLENDNAGKRWDYADPAPVYDGESSASSASKRGGTTKPIKSILFTIRPWTSVLLNEGSSTRVYKTYEFFLKRPPSILGALLGSEETPNDEPLIPHTVRSLSYIAIFPLSSHFNTLVSHLPPLDKLYLQLVPRNDILDDKEEMRNIQVSDLWMERNTCYSLVMRALFGVELSNGWEPWDDDFPDRGRGWRTLKIFESGDAADKEAWDMAVDYVRMSGTSWRPVADGVLVKGDRRAGDGGDGGDESNNDALSDAESPASNTTGFELFQGDLEMLAFNGIAELPYSPSPYYTNSQ